MAGGEKKFIVESVELKVKSFFGIIVFFVYLQVNYNKK